MIRPTDRSLTCGSLDANDFGGLAGLAAAVNRAPPRSLDPAANSRVNVEPLSPFGRGTNAPLAGRTILQIVPPLAAGGDERSTLAVAEALVEAGARALVASDPGELASELHAVGGLHVPFPATTKNPLALSLNVGRRRESWNRSG